MKKFFSLMVSFLMIAVLLCACAKPGENGTTTGSGLPTAEELFEEATKDDPDGWFTENGGFIFEIKEGRAFKTDKGVPTFYYVIYTEDASVEWFRLFFEKFQKIITENNLAERGNASWYISVMYLEDMSSEQVGNISYLVLDGKEYSEVYPTDPEFADGLGEDFEKAYESNAFFSGINSEDIDSLVFSESSAE